MTTWGAAAPRAQRAPPSMYLVLAYCFGAFAALIVLARLWLANLTARKLAAKGIGGRIGGGAARPPFTEALSSLRCQRGRHGEGARLGSRQAETHCHHLGHHLGHHPGNHLVTSTAWSTGSRRRRSSTPSPLRLGSGRHDLQAQGGTHANGERRGWRPAGAFSIMAGIAKAICIMQQHWAEARRWAKQGHEAKQGRSRRQQHLLVLRQPPPPLALGHPAPLPVP